MQETGLVMANFWPAPCHAGPFGSVLLGATISMCSHMQEFAQLALR